MNLVMIGYRGTGKSAIGRLLSMRLRIPCIAIDDEVEKEAGMTIPELVNREGWQGFRDLESELTRKFAAMDEVILDTGGGVIERPENIETLKKKGCIVWLTARVETIVARISSGTNRPALTAGKSFTEEVAEILERRTPIYAAVAQHRIDTDELTPEEIADRIAEIWTKSKAIERG